MPETEKRSVAAPHARPRNWRGATTPRSVRVPDPVWDPAVAKAHAQGITASWAVNALLAGWVAGEIELPEPRLSFG